MELVKERSDVMELQQRIWQQATSIFYHIHQVAALVVNLRMCGTFATPILGEG